MNPAALEASSLSRRYGGTWALRDCSLSLPTARVVALVGPNGAGKTTLLHLATGLLQPTSGSIRVLGEVPGANPEILGRVGFVAQEMPLYRNFTVAEMLRFGEQMNPTWDRDLAVGRLESLTIPLTQKVGTLSGGQRGQVSLAIALAKRPELLLLDEPLASLDPLARTGLPRRADGERGRGRRECRAVVASGERPGAGLRSPGRPPERQRRGRRRHRRSSSGPIAS